MIKVKRAALPENRQALDQYLSDQTFGRIELLLRSTRSLSHSIPADRCLSQATEAYTKLEEERLEEALSRMAYDIDTPEVVSLITGPGRIERVSIAFFFQYSYADLRCLLVHFPALVSADETAYCSCYDVQGACSSLRRVWGNDYDTRVYIRGFGRSNRWVGVIV
jgi:hypothetical protein